MSTPEAVPLDASRGGVPPGRERSRETAPAHTMRQLKPLIVLATIVLVFVCLARAREVLIPIAFASLLALVLTPAVGFVQRRGVPRVVAVILVVVLACSIIGGVVWMLAQQVATIANDLPRYRENLREKVADIRWFGRGGPIAKVQETVKDVVGEMQKDDRAPRQQRPIPVVSAETPFWQLPSTLGAIAKTAITIAFVIVLVVFMLLERQELRNRLIRLFGHGRIAVTTRAIDEATQGIIRYLLMQSLVNAGFGAAVAGGLFLLGVPYPVLWGALAALLRFIPYVGTWMAALLPIAMSLAIFPGWTTALSVVALFAVLEPVIYMVVEPILYGHSIGVTQTALLVAVAFWTWLWGPLGLILATPLTVCLVVLAKYVPELDFILTLVSDRPVLAPDVAYYQRLVAMDLDEAAEIVEKQRPALERARLYDEVMLPALNYARRDLARGRITEDELAFVARATREILEGTVTPQTPPAATPRRGRVLGCPGRDEADEVALRMLADLLAPAGATVETLSAETLTAEVVSLVEQARRTCICVTALPPGGLAHTRYLLKQVRARFPDVCILVGRWGFKGEVEEDAAPLLAAGATRVATTLAATRDQVLEFVPLTPAEPSALPRSA